MKPRVFCTFCLLVSGIAAALAFQTAQIQTPPSPAQAAKPPAQFRLEDATPIKLRLQRTLSSADAQVDDRVDFDVLEEIKVNDAVVIPKGSVAWGTVTEAQPKRRMGHGGKLNVNIDSNIDSVRLADGEKAALRAVKDVKGASHVGRMTGAIVATSIVFFPAAPFFLFMHGKDITIPKGTEITSYINGDMSLDPAKFGVKPAAESQTATTPPAVIPAPQSAPQTAPPAALPEPSTVSVKSSPDGADLTVDGKYMGSTPSTIRIAPGDHTILIEKPGFQPWQRNVTVGSGGFVTIDATLQKVL